MEARLTAIELTGTVNERRQLQLDDLLPIAGPRRVRVIVLYSADEDGDEAEWLQAAASNPTFAVLKEASEDIYSVSDGKPFDPTVTLQLPASLSQAILQRGIPRQRLSWAVARFVELYLDELALDAGLTKAPWLDGGKFARQVIGQNRALFEELARL